MDLKSCPNEYRGSFISHDQNANTPSLSREVTAVMRDAVEWDDTSDLRYAAISQTPLSGQPRQVSTVLWEASCANMAGRTYIQVDGMDLLRDDGLVYDEMLQAAGVSTKLDFYPGCPHAHWAQMRGTEIANRALIDTIVGLGWLLQIDVPREQAAGALGVQLV